MTASEYSIRVARKNDLVFVAERMRAPDVAEVWASCHLTPLAALRASRRASRNMTFVGLANDTPVCVWGIAPGTLLNPVARPWLLGTDEMYSHSRAFLRHSRRMVEILKQAFPWMGNYVDARNTAAIRWLQWLGFSVYYPAPHGMEQMPFHYFEMRS